LECLGFRDGCKLHSVKPKSSSRIHNATASLAFVASVVALLTLLSCGRQQSDPAKATALLDPAVSLFAYANRDGNRLIAWTNENKESDKAQKIETAVCSDGREFPIRYVEFQKLGKDHNGRQTMYNFDNDQGSLYEVSAGKAEPNETCLLIPAGYLRDYPDVPNEFPRAEREKRGNDLREQAARKVQTLDGFSKDVVARIEKAKGRSVNVYWLLHRVGPSQQVAAVEFNPVGEDRLASIVLAESNQLSFFDMPATVKGGDCWRVSDGCRFYPENLEVPIVLGHPDGQILVLTWQAEEGQLILQFKAGGGKLTEIRRDYRYTLAK